MCIIRSYNSWLAWLLWLVNCTHIRNMLPAKRIVEWFMYAVVLTWTVIWWQSQHLISWSIINILHVHIAFLSLKLSYSYFGIIKDLRLSYHHRILHVKTLRVSLLAQIESKYSWFIVVWLECEKCGFDQQQRSVLLILCVMCSWYVETPQSS